MRVFWRNLSYLVAMAMVLWVGLQPQFTASQNLTTTTVISTSFEQPIGAPDINAIYEEVNAQRAAKGLHPLERNQDLARVAQERAVDMQTKRYYAHQSPTGDYFYNLLDPVAYNGVYACENLDLQATLDTQTYINDWLQSKKGHRECMLNEAVLQAGYAVAVITLPKVKTNATMYVVVAIHAATPPDTL